MRILVLSDIHANYEALQAVLNDAGAVDEVWCLGDVVGYGPDPNLCIETLRELPNLTCIAGNHDVAVLGEMPLSVFNGEARHALMWQRQALTLENLAFLRTLPQTPLVRGAVTLAHGSPRDPIWEYILNTLTARLNMEHFDTPFCFVGHSHIQGIFHFNPEHDRLNLIPCRPGQVFPMTPRAILNPGSVGQPRDRDPRAAYAIYDPEARTWEPRRIAYNIAAVQKRIRDLGLPERHAARLTEGW